MDFRIVPISVFAYPAAATHDPEVSGARDVRALEILD